MAKIKLIVAVSVPDELADKVVKMLEWDSIFRGNLVYGGSVQVEGATVEVESVVVVK